MDVGLIGSLTTLGGMSIAGVGGWAAERIDDSLNRRKLNEDTFVTKLKDKFKRFLYAVSYAIFIIGVCSVLIGGCVSCATMTFEDLYRDSEDYEYDYIRK